MIMFTNKGQFQKTKNSVIHVIYINIYLNVCCRLIFIKLLTRRTRKPLKLLFLYKEAAVDNCPKDFFLWGLLEIPGNMSMTKFN